MERSHSTFAYAEGGTNFVFETSSNHQLFHHFIRHEFCGPLTIKSSWMSKVEFAHCHQWSILNYSLKLAEHLFSVRQNGILYKLRFPTSHEMLLTLLQGQCHVRLLRGLSHSLYFILFIVSPALIVLFYLGIYFYRYSFHFAVYNYWPYKEKSYENHNISICLKKKKSLI